MRRNSIHQASSFAVSIAWATLVYSLNQMLSRPVSGAIVFGGSFLVAFGLSTIYRLLQDVLHALEVQRLFLKRVTERAEVGVKEPPKAMTTAGGK